MKLKHKMAKCGRMENFILALLYNLYLTRWNVKDVEIK